MTEGLNENHRNEIAEEYQGGEVHLLETTIADDDGETELNNNSEASVTTDDGDWSISHDSGVETTELENTEAFNFGEPGDITINQIIVQSTVDGDKMLRENDPEGDTDLDSDDEYEIPAADLTYTLGGE